VGLLEGGATMQAMRVGRRVLLSAILSAGMAIGCTTTDECNGSGGSGGGEPSPYGFVPDDLPGTPVPVHDMECPPGITIITGTLDGAPYTLMAASTFDLNEHPGGFIEVFFPSDVPNDDFLYLTSAEDIWPTKRVPILGTVKLPHTTRHYQVRHESGFVIGSEYKNVDFHLILADDAHFGDLEGCGGGYLDTQ
jgi:hypothetical protein